MSFLSRVLIVEKNAIKKKKHHFFLFYFLSYIGQCDVKDTISLWRKNAK